MNTSAVSPGSRVDLLVEQLAVGGWFSIGSRLTECRARRCHPPNMKNQSSPRSVGRSLRINLAFGIASADKISRTDQIMSSLPSVCPNHLYARRSRQTAFGQGHRQLDQLRDERA